MQNLREDELYRGSEAAGRFRSSCCAMSTKTADCRCVNFAAGGVATPADAALMMQLGAEGVFVGSGIFKSGDPAKACGGHRAGRYQLHRCQS